MQRPLLLSLCLCAFLPGAAHAQPSALNAVQTNRYTDAIRTVLGDRTDPSSLNAEGLQILALAYLERATFLSDLSYLQTLLGEAYYARRDTSSGVVQSPQTPFFRGRYLYELERYREALALFEQAAQTTELSSEWRGKARIWAGAAAFKLGNPARADAWWSDAGGTPVLRAERAFARWKSGAAATEAAERDVAQETTDAVSLQRQQLWDAALREDIAAVTTLRGFFLDDRIPDMVHQVDRELSIQFYDPATLQVLALADYLAARDALLRLADRGNSQDVRYLAGICDYRAGRLDQARRLFEQATDPRRALYLGALTYPTDPAAAEQYWAPIRPKAELEWLELAAPLIGRRAVLNASAAERETPPENRAAALRLGRALLQVGANQEALRVLDAAYPHARTNDLASIKPDYTVALAVAKLAQGRQYQFDVFEHLVSLTDAYPVVRNVLDLARGAFVPEPDAGGQQRRTGS